MLDSNSFKKKLQYIWDYYKPAIFLGVFLIYLVTALIIHFVTLTKPVCYLGFVNVAISDDLNQKLTDDFLFQLPKKNTKDSIETYDSLYLTDDLSKTDSEYVYASQMKILAAINAQKLDLVILDQEGFDAFAQNGYLQNMETYLKKIDPNLYKKLSPYIVENLQILSDNASDVVLDPTIEYESQTTEYPMGLDLSFSPLISDAGFPEHVYLGIIANSPRDEIIRQYLDYIYN